MAGHRSSNVDTIVELLDAALSEPVVASGPARRVVAEIADPHQRTVADVPTADPGCWRCGGGEEIRPATGLCRPCVLFLAEVRDTDPRPAFHPDLLRDELAAATRAVMNEVAHRRNAKRPGA